ncbi:MAG: hypothetical protein KGJ57_01025 [Sphingomonadales bacterium]|nr:hypothetical protein [Sphingomonadales bacterium]MDE2167991.1 hypothetical protein [Sphingomonadales bacterium]
MLAVGLVAGALAAQQGPESLLPPGFDRPAPRAPRPAPRPTQTAAPQRVAPAPARAMPTPHIDLNPAEPTISAQPLFAQPGAPHMPTGPIKLPAGIASYDQLIALPPDQLDQALGLKPKYDIPPGAGRALRMVGMINESEGGLPSTLANQNADLLRAVLTGNGGQILSRWGHILLRRALVSRMDAPANADPADVVAMRAALLLRMGEGNAARELVQDVDPDNYNPSLTQAAMDSYVATEDFTGFCPIIGAQPPPNAKDPRWGALKAMCDAFSGNAASGFASLDHMTFVGAMPRVDMMLAQKFAGAAGGAGRSGRRRVGIEWDQVTDMTLWRYGLTLAVGLTPPASLMKDLPPGYAYVTATAPMVGLGDRANASDVAGMAGVLSAGAMVDLYSQVYANDDISGGAADRALLLRDAYVATSPADRLKAMKQLWDGADAAQRYGRLVLTAYAAARMPVSGDYSADAGDLVASMLAAGLDANALRWMGAVDKGSLAWAQLTLVDPGTGEADTGGISSFASADKSVGQRKTAFLVAGLAGLGRASDGTRRDYAGKLSVDYDSHSRWSDSIDQAAVNHNPLLVVMLAGLGMQGDSWARMTPRYLYHIVSALSRVGLRDEARLIAAEAVARG